MRHKVVICDESKCTGCRLCEYACSVHVDKSLNVRNSRMRTIRIDPIFNAATGCILCQDMPCIDGCPTQAIAFDKAKKAIAIDEAKCDACGLCIERCPYGSISLPTEKKTAIVCDMCKGEPKCVELCPKNALSFNYINEKSFQGRIKR
jgi:anaerobic carbon-monoxide dehydrogenase iron sulfur subunit